MIILWIDNQIDDVHYLLNITTKFMLPVACLMKNY